MLRSASAGDVLDKDELVPAGVADLRHLDDFRILCHFTQRDSGGVADACLGCPGFPDFPYNTFLRLLRDFQVSMDLGNLMTDIKRGTNTQTLRKRRALSALLSPCFVLFCD